VRRAAECVLCKVGTLEVHETPAAAVEGREAYARVSVTARKKRRRKEEFGCVTVTVCDGA
jgi:hypothetical protein